MSPEFKPENGADGMIIFERVRQTSSKIQARFNCIKSNRQHLYKTMKQMRFSMRQKRYGLLSENKKP